jgi:hypothetical protein
MMQSPTATAGRVLESAAEALLIVVLVVTAADRTAPDADLAAVALPAFAVLGAAVYAFHGLTFDAFRLIGQRHRSTESSPGVASPFRQ